MSTLKIYPRIESTRCRTTKPTLQSSRPRVLMSSISRVGIFHRGCEVRLSVNKGVTHLPSSSTCWQAIETHAIYEGVYLYMKNILHCLEAI